MHVGLDLGSTGARVLTVTPHTLEGKRTSLNYSLLPDTGEQRRHLLRAGIQFASCDGYLLLLGNSATEYSRIFHSEPQSLLPFGELPLHDILGRQILASYINQLIPNRRGQLQEAICCYSHPLILAEADHPTAEHNRFLTQVLNLANYIPLPLSAGMAIVLAEMVDLGFTGIAMVFGSSCSEMTISFQGQEILRSSAPIGGDWIDDELARRLDRYLFDDQGMRYPDLLMIRRWRERLAQPLMEPRTRTDEMICEVYTEFLVDVLSTCLDRVRIGMKLPRDSWPLVCSGGLTRTNGFKPLINRVLMEMNLPFSISQLKLAPQTDFVIARGCLANAFLESSIQQQRQVA